MSLDAPLYLTKFPIIEFERFALVISVFSWIKLLSILLLTTFVPSHNETFGPIFEFSITSFSPMKHGGIIKELFTFAESGIFSNSFFSKDNILEFVSTVTSLFPQSIHSLTSPKVKILDFDRIFSKASVN